MRTLLGVAVLVCTGCFDRESASVFAVISGAQIHVERTHLEDLADLRVSAHFYALHRRNDEVVLHSGWLVGDEGTLVATLGLALPKRVWLTPDEPRQVDLINKSVTNGSLVGLCDLQLDVGLTVSGVHDPDRSGTLGYPVKVECD